MKHAILNILAIMDFSIVVWLTGYPEIVAAEDAVTDGLMQEERPMLDIPFAQAPPVIDGDLNDVIWEKARIKLGDWISYNPLRGETIEQKTEVFIAYDKKNLYFAFRCLDPEPDKIKTSICRRDSLFQDDWVGLSLDAMGNGQLSYDMFVNPSGVQADILTSASNGEDLGVDWVWHSAGKRDEHGYSTEIQLPLKSIRFKSGSQVRMGILFWRRVSRLGVSVSWPAIPDGQWVFKCNADMIMHDLKSPLVLDIIPSFTYSRNQDRADPAHWDKASSDPDVGITLKYGLTSNITLDLTANPDFSQVESDAFQMEVNRRYPVFYSERRPFFMEGSSLFNMRSGSNMSTTVHTRRIIDPILGVKLTGTIGKFSFGTLTASDQAPGRPYNDGTANPYLGDNKLFYIGRATYSLGKGSYIGAIFTDTELGDSFNRVVGSDFYLSIREHHHLSGNYLYTRSAADSSHTRSGMEGYASYTYLSRRFTFSPQIEHYDDDFQMDTAFYNRTGITMGSAYMDVNFYPNKEKYPWLKRIIPSFNYRYGRDRIAGGIERSAQISLDFRLTRQGFFGISYRAGKEPWAHQSFKTDGVSLYGRIQILKWLQLNSSGGSNYATYYDRENPFLGRSRNYSAGFVLQPSEKFAQRINYYHETFNRADTGERVYRVNLINSRSSYQFNRQLFLRAILRYDSSRQRVLTDFLGAYELVPGTVFYVGYGSLIERRGWDSSQRQWIYNSGDFLTTRRGLFIKLSYLQRF